MAYEAMHAAEQLEKEGVSAEVVDVRSIRPLDEDTILQSVRKTGRLIVADTSWELCGLSSEVAALAAEKAFHDLKAPVRRIALANCPAPVSQPLEKAFYPTATTIAKAALRCSGSTHPRSGTSTGRTTSRGRTDPFARRRRVRGAQATTGRRLPSLPWRCIGPLRG